MRETYKKQHKELDWAVIDRTQRAAEKALIEAIVQASNKIPSMEHSFRIASPMGTLATIYQVLEIGKSPIQEVYVLSKRSREQELIEVLSGVIIVTALDPVQIRSEAEQILGKIDIPYEQIWRSISEAVEYSSGRDVSWSLAANGKLNPEALSRALFHPSQFVCKFSADLLINCFDIETQRRCFAESLTNGTIYALHVLGQIAKDVWEADAAEMICTRLEQNMTPICAPLVKGLGQICDASFSDRVAGIIQKALVSECVDMVEAGLIALQDLALHPALHNTVQECYHWWLREGPSDSDCSGTVPDSAASTLLAYLITQDSITEAGLIEAVNAKRSDVRRVAIRELCSQMASDDSLAVRVLDDVINSRLPLELLDTLSRLQPNVCKRHFERIVAFLNLDNHRMREAGIRALGDGWADYSLAEKELRPLLQSEDVSLRDAAVGALRRLQVQKKIE